MAEIDVIPGVFESDLDLVEKKLLAVAPHVSWVHIDISDGTFSPKQTTTDIDTYAKLISTYPNCSFEAHLMVANPEKYIRTLVDAGFSRLIAHVECYDPRRFLDEARYDEVEVGLAIDGATEVEQIEPFLEEVDGVVVSTREMGDQDHVFLPEAVERIKLIHQNFPDLPITAVGGLNEEHAKTVKEAGATRLVVASYIFKSPGNEAEAIETLKTV